MHMHKKGHNWIGPLKKGALHKELHVAMGHHLSLSQLQKAKAKGGLEAKRAQFAINARHWHHGGKK